MSALELTLTTSTEWSIIQIIAETTVRRWSHHQRASVRGQLTRTSGPKSVNNDLTFLETDLRQLFLVRLDTNTLPESLFIDIQKSLKLLCGHLEGFVNLELITTSKANEPHVSHYPRAAYPRLQALCEYLRGRTFGKISASLEETAGSIDEIPKSLDVDLIASPIPISGQKVLFLVPSDSKVKDVLEVTKACNLILGTQFQKQLGSGYTRPIPKQNDSAATAFSNRATSVLQVLLDHYSTCKSTHEVLLSLSDKLEAAGPNGPIPTLDILLSDCSRTHQRHDAQCIPYRRDYHEESYEAREVADLCNELHQRHIDDTLVLFFESNVLFNGRELRGPPSSSVIQIEEAVLKSHAFERLVKLGAFRPYTQDNFASTEIAIGPYQKDIVALKLAHCLAQSFLNTKSGNPLWDSKRIYLFQPPGSDEDYIGRLYMTFTDEPCQRRQPPADTVCIGQQSSSVLLAFAKLLLELKFGEEIDLSECSDLVSQWRKLCQYADRAQLEGGGLYAEAIHAALYLPKQQPRARESRLDALQRAVREEILGRLEIVEKPPTAGTKRRRSDANLAADEDQALPAIAEGDTEEECGDEELGVMPSRPPKRRRRFPTRQIKTPVIEINEVEIVLGEPSRKQTLPRTPKTQNPESRLSVFRVRQVKLEHGQTTEQTVRDIIKANVEDCTLIHGDVWGVTVSRKRGSALLYFRGEVPECFRVLLSSGQVDVMTDKQSGQLERTLEVDAHFIGLTHLYEPSPDMEVKADIFAIHGLNGHPFGSWLSKTDRPTMWLRDFLPEDIEDCRIFLYGYDSNFLSNIDRDHPKHDLAAQAKTLLASLSKVRSRKTEKRPIIFIAHSYGGLVLARALVEAFTMKSPVHSATTALFLMACPMRNFHVDDILNTMDSNDANREEVDRACLLVQRLGKGDFLLNELSGFREAAKNIKVFSYYESGKTQELTRSSGRPQRDGDSVMAASASSVLLGWENEVGIRADKDHSNIVKFSTRSDDTYQDILCRIQEVLEDFVE